MFREIFECHLLMLFCHVAWNLLVLHKFQSGQIKLAKRRVENSQGVFHTIFMLMKCTINGFSSPPYVNHISHTQNIKDRQDVIFKMTIHTCTNVCEWILLQHSIYIYSTENIKDRQDVIFKMTIHTCTNVCEWILLQHSIYIYSTEMSTIKGLLDIYVMHNLERGTGKYSSLFFSFL